ncbi:MAG: flagellar brake protein [Lachnospiraceae bacterium]|nr:flagellar brake protein [Lachnospiraceae bacterium]
MNNTMFKVGDRIEMTHAVSAIGGVVSEKKYGSQLLDFDGIRTAKIAMPIYENRLVPLDIGDEYQICFFTNAGLYQCRARIQRRYTEKKMHVMDVIFLTELKKFQRRKFYRLDCMFSVKYRIISEVERTLRERLEKGDFESEEKRQDCLDSLEQIPKEWMDGTISDLSGGGMRFHSSKELEKDGIVEVRLPLSFRSGILPMTFILRVVACTHYEGSRVAYEIRGEFENIKDSEREIVVKYVFEEQRRRLRKE